MLVQRERDVIRHGTIVQKTGKLLDTELLYREQESYQPRGASTENREVISHGALVQRRGKLSATECSYREQAGEQTARDEYTATSR